MLIFWSWVLCLFCKIGSSFRFTFFYFSAVTLDIELSRQFDVTLKLTQYLCDTLSVYMVTLTVISAAALFSLMLLRSCSPHGQRNTEGWHRVVTAGRPAVWPAWLHPVLSFTLERERILRRGFHGHWASLGNIISGRRGIRGAAVTQIMRKWPRGINIAGWDDHFRGFTPAKPRDQYRYHQACPDLITMESTKRFIQFPIKGKLFDINDNIF